VGAGAGNRPGYLTRVLAEGTPERLRARTGASTIEAAFLALVGAP
jgi:hypothetical protein